MYPTGAGVQRLLHGPRDAVHGDRSPRRGRCVGPDCERGEEASDVHGRTRQEPCAVRTLWLPGGRACIAVTVISSFLHFGSVPAIANAISYGHTATGNVRSLSLALGLSHLDLEGCLQDTVKTPKEGMKSTAPACMVRVWGPRANGEAQYI